MSKSEIKDEYGFVDSFLANGTHGQPAGTVTDDTEQALCIATSLASLGEWDPESASEQFVDWYKSKPFDIGRTTAQSMENLAANMDWEKAGKVTQSELPDERATNGSVMRCAPLAIAYPYDTQKLIQYSRESSLITHAHPRCQYGAAILNLTLANILTFTENPLLHALDSVRGDAPDGLVSRLSSLGETSEAELSGSGDVTDTLETALYYGLTGASFFEAVMNAVNNGGDTDTIGAITGAVAGARFGLDPTFGQNKEASVDRSLLRQTSTSGLLTLATCIHEIENGIGASHRNENWSMYASRRQTGAGQADT
jgi:ADP-ribosyl-[dinitrogen reductase] hydrolase